jgi:DNA polymerase-3 subunit alpha
VVGVYISGHPLDDFKFELKHFTNAPVTVLENLEEVKKRKDVKVAGVITSVSHLMTKMGAPFGKFVLEDFEGSYEFALFKDDYIRFRNYLNEYWFVMVEVSVRGWYNKTQEKEILRLNVTNIELLSDIRDKKVKQLQINLPLDAVDPIMTHQLKNICNENKGSIPVQFNVRDKDVYIEMRSRSLKISMSKSLTDSLERMEAIQWKVDKV